MDKSESHDLNRGRTVGAGPRESSPILPPDPDACTHPGDGCGCGLASCLGCEDPACAEHGPNVRRVLGLAPPPADLLTVDASPLVALANTWDERATALEVAALIAHAEAVDVEPGPMWVTRTARLLERAASMLRDANAIRARRSDLVRTLSFLGVAFVLALSVGGCVAVVDDSISVVEACEQYEAETEGAPCEYPCPWAGEGRCDVERVSRCARAVHDVCDTFTPPECDAACEVGR